jgi:hypothetical protein
MTAATLLDKLDGVMGRGPRYRAICPAHQSKHGTRSLSVLEETDGRVLVHCFAGCGVDEVLAAVGLDLDALFPEKAIDHHRPRVRKPFLLRDVVAALKGELMLAFVVLAAVQARTPINDADAERAGVALDRIVTFLRALENAS